MSHIDMGKVRDPWCWYHVKAGKKYRGIVTSLYKDGRADLVMIDAGVSGGSWDIQDAPHGSQPGQWEFCNPDPAILKLAEIVKEFAKAIPDEKPAPVPDSEPKPAPKKVGDDGFFESEPAEAGRKSAARATRQ